MTEPEFAPERRHGADDLGAELAVQAQGQEQDLEVDRPIIGGMGPDADHCAGAVGGNAEQQGFQAFALVLRPHVEKVGFAEFVAEIAA